MILVDTSAWVDFLRRTGSAQDKRVDRLLAREDELATTDPVLMEVLAGARDVPHRDRLRRLLGRCDFVPVEGPRDYEYAADVFRLCRDAGDGVRSLSDCLIASVAIRAGLAVLQRDRDFVSIARHTQLELA